MRSFIPAYRDFLLAPSPGREREQTLVSLLIRALILSDRGPTVVALTVSVKASYPTQSH